MSEARNGASRLRIHAWIVFAVLAAAYFFVYFHRMAVGIVGSDMVEDVGGTMGVLSSAYFWTYTAMQIPCGLLTDRFGPRAVTTAFLAIASVGSLVTAVGGEFWMMILGKVLIAAGMAVVYVPLMKIVSVWFPKRDFAALSGVVIAVGNVGAIAASAPLAYLADAVGWRDVFLILGGVTLLLAMLCLAVVRDHPSARGLPSTEDLELGEGRAVEESSSAKVPTLEGLRIVLSGGMRFWPVALAYFLVYGTIMTFQGTWAVKYFDSVYGFALSAAWMATAIGIGKIVATLAIGAMASRGIVSSKKDAMVAGTSVFAMTWTIIALFAGEIDSYWFWMAVCAVFGVSGGFMTLSFAAIKEWYPIAVAGTAVSATNIFLFLGASVGTTLSGWIIGSSYALEDFRAAWAVMLAASVAAVALLCVFRERRPDDPLYVGGCDSADSTISYSKKR